MKTIISVVGIRPDFIRMSEVFKKLDQEFNHYILHTGQHFDEMLSGVFFNDLTIRKPDFNLNMGKEFKTHHELSGMMGSRIIDLINAEGLKPDAFFFLGDSNSVASAMTLKKEYGDTVKNIHCEAGMRSYDKRMLEEINRTVCDHCSDIHFVYHEDYKLNLVKENLPNKNIYVVGNTIVEVCNKFKNEIVNVTRSKDFILMDIHRPENFKYKDRMVNIFSAANDYSNHFGVPVRALKFGRTMEAIKLYNINTYDIQFIDLMSYKDFLKAQYHSLFCFSDSGTAAEEPALLDVSVIVPRDYTERPQSYKYSCSSPLYVMKNGDVDRTMTWLVNHFPIDSSWLGDGTTSDKICTILKEIL